jgi:hypothetical protein
MWLLTSFKSHKVQIHNKSYSTTRRRRDIIL